MATAATVVTGTRQSVYSANIRGELIVCQCGWDAEQEAVYGIDAIVAGDVEATRWTATQDGRSVIAQWETGAGCGDDVYYERQDGSHGWIDAVSRKIVQTG